MALQASGTIRYSEIIAEFGTPNNGGLGQYHISEKLQNPIVKLPWDCFKC